MLAQRGAHATNVFIGRAFVIQTFYQKFPDYRPNLLKTSWVCCIPAGMSVLVLTKINKFHPFELNEYPNSLYIYYVHILNPTLIVLPLVIFHFSRDKELRRAAKSTICPMPPVREDEEGCAPPIYKV